MDFSGFFFLAIWLLTLQIVLDKGNDADWFGAPWICKLLTVSTLCFFAFVYIQKKKAKTGDGLINLSILRNKNFLIGTGGQIVLMMILMSSAAILPSMLQRLLGYTSFLSGLSMIPRGAGCFVASILSGILVVRLGIKPVAALGLVTLAIGGLLFGEINTNIALANIALPNFVFGAGMVLSMVPLSNISCATLSNEEQTNASGVQNLFKNVGAAIGTSIATTMIARFSQAHQMMMVKSLTDTNPVFTERVGAISSAFMSQVDPLTAVHMAHGQIYRLLSQQAALWGYVETFRYYAVAVVLILPFIYFLNDTSRKKADEKSNV
jgi:DHA2 family multidrug resistance protein